VASLQPGVNVTES